MGERKNRRLNSSAYLEYSYCYKNNKFLFIDKIRILQLLFKAPSYFCVLRKPIRSSAKRIFKYFEKYCEI